MDKYDIRKAHKPLYKAFTTDFSVIDVPTLQYIAVEGHGDPNTSTSYSDAVEALYSVAYALKFDSKKNLERDFAVGPLEGLWRADDMSAFISRDKNAWSWTMMISQPDSTHGLVPTSDHHEIYLSDPRRTAPEKLKTILRQPVAEAASRD